jgi:hypothetical protein
MKRILLLTAFLIVNLSLTWSRLPDTLSDSARFSLITVAPGEFVYSTFGHTALRLKDAASGVDVCFNYGTFDFEQPGFVLKFCQGKLLYMLDIENYRDFEYGNLYFRRPMIEQVLNLSPEQKSKLYALLRDNYRPENRFYKYDFFYDNCATRVRDILENTLGGNPGYYTEMTGNGVTMRQLLHKYLPAKPWLGFGIDLILGTPADKIATVRDYMFLPDYLYLFLGESHHTGWTDGHIAGANDSVRRCVPSPSAAQYNYCTTDSHHGFVAGRTVFCVPGKGKKILRQPVLGFTRNRRVLSLHCCGSQPTIQPPKTI